MRKSLGKETERKRNREEKNHHKTLTRIENEIRFNSLLCRSLQLIQWNLFSGVVFYSFFRANDCLVRSKRFSEQFTFERTIDVAPDTDLMRCECCRIEHDTTKSVSGCSRFELVSFRCYFFAVPHFFFSFGYLPASRREYLRSLDTNIWMWIATACLRHLSQIQWQAHWIRWHVEENERPKQQLKRSRNIL